MDRPTDSDKTLAMTLPLTENGYTEKEMREMISQMSEVSKAYYYHAQKIGCHPFIEFCGLMNIYIDMARASVEKGIQIAFASTHNGIALEAKNYQVDYLAEKFDCIFGPTLQDKTLREVFLKKMGWDDLIQKASPPNGEEVSAVYP